MGRTVIVAEKPSVGADIARVLGCRSRGKGCITGDQYTVTWAVGHLVEHKNPDEIDARYKKWSMGDLPILPEVIPLKVISSSRDQYAVVKELINADDTERVVCATDAGREGELIFRYIYQQAKCTKPVDRLWISSMTDEAIRDGFAAIRPDSDYDPLYRSAKCRSDADWLVGMNASRAFSIQYNSVLSVGRVQTPTLAILVSRRKEIEAFVPEGFCTVTADFGDYKGDWFREGQENDTHIAEKKDADAIAAKVKGKPAVVRSAETKRKTEPPPQLYDLTSLQRDANRLLGFKADQTLKLAQSLYEKHKALTYPRTDSRYLPPDMVPKVSQTLKLLPDSYQGYLKLAMPEGSVRATPRTVDASKVSDHHALIPTARKVDPDTFSADERSLYDLVARRTIAAFCPPQVYDATKVITVSEGETFRSNGRVVIDGGWRAVPPLAHPPRAKKKAGEDEDAQPLPPLKAGDPRTVKGAAVKEDKTKPPAQHTDASLLSAMENAGRELDDEELRQQMKGSGLGTPATRAATIERLIKVGYAVRQGKAIIATDKGVKLISLMPKTIASPEFTGKWELALDHIAHGQGDPTDFMAHIRRYTASLVTFASSGGTGVTFSKEDEKKAPGKATKAGKASKASGGKRTGKAAEKPAENGMKCPICGKGAVMETQRAFGCSRWKQGCLFTLWKDCLQRGDPNAPLLTERIVGDLLKSGRCVGRAGVIQMDRQRIGYYPTGAESATASAPVVRNK